MEVVSSNVPWYPELFFTPLDPVLLHHGVEIVVAGRAGTLDCSPIRTILQCSSLGPFSQQACYDSPAREFSYRHGCYISLQVQAPVHVVHGK
jgi:hypothetical protein